MAFDGNRDSWNPRQVLAAKTMALQLDFVDAGLMPTLEGMCQRKLDVLLKRAVQDVVGAYRDATGQPPDPKELFRLLFRFVAAKVLRDRGQSGPWHSSDAAEVFRVIEEYYQRGHEALPAAAPPPTRVLAQAWNSISTGFHFQNLAADDLAFVYENTFVTKETRETYGTHSTPPHIAEYMVRKLPFESLPADRRRVFEPCAGHGVFLVSAMRRLRELLGPGMTSDERHEYLRERLVGIELDAFAREVCLLTLLLADYPNPNGWQLTLGDAFTTPRFQVELRRADVVLCNPPFRRAAEMLGRVLAEPPDLLGFVLPRVFISGPSYAEHRYELARHYSAIELLALPDHVFTHSDHETVLLVASGRRTNNLWATVTCRIATGAEYPAFREHGLEPRAEVATRAVPETITRPFRIWAPTVSQLWDHLDTAPRLSALADVVRGVEWLTSEMVSRELCAGWQPAYTSAEEGVGQYRLGASRYVDPSEVNRHRRRRAWSDPKVIATKHAVSRTPWRIAASTDYQGALVTQEFYAVYPRASDVTPEVIAALLNGPVANAWLYAWEDKRDNRWQTCMDIPVPPLAYLDQGLIVEKVRMLEHMLSGRADALTSPHDLARLLAEIDAAVLQAYALPPELERQLLTLFGGVRRPVSTHFAGYDDSFEAARRAILDEQHQRRSERYQELVELKYIQGLTPSQTEEMQRLGKQIDEYYAPFYERLLADLRSQRRQEGHVH